MFSNSSNSKQVLNCIRWLSRRYGENSFTKNDVAAILRLQWATVSNLIGALRNDNFFVDENSLQLNSRLEYYVGVSVGSSRIKLVFLDFCFNTVNLSSLPRAILNLFKEFRYKYEHYLDDSDTYDLEQMCLCLNINNREPSNEYKVSNLTVLNDICDLLADMKLSSSASDFNIGAVGFAFPGYIDSSSNTICTSYLFGNMTNISLGDLLRSSVYKKFTEAFTKDEKQLYFFDKNCDAACIAEKEVGKIAPALTAKPNIATIYGGYGYGISFTLRNQLYSNTFCGQFGHVQVDPYETGLSKNSCRCGKINCLENRIHLDVFDKYLYTEEEFKSKSVKELSDILIKNPKKKMIFAEYLGQAIYNIVQLLGIDTIILSGKLPALCEHFDTELMSALLEYSISPQNVIMSSLKEFSAAIGAAVGAYYRKYDMPLIWK